MSNKNSLIEHLHDLIFLSNSIILKNKSLMTVDELIKGLNNFNEYCKNNGDRGDCLILKLKLLNNLALLIGALKKNSHKCVFLDAMTNILRISVVDDIEFFVNLYNSTFYQIYEDENGLLSEELKLAVLQCSVELIKRSTKRLLQLLYNENYAVKFSMGVLVAVKIAKEEKSFKLRVTALDFLLYAMQYQRRNDKCIQTAVGNLFMLYLPGVINRIEEILLRDETQPHLITIKALCCWGQILGTVMQDLENDAELSDSEQIKMWLHLTKEGSNRDSKLFDLKKALSGKVRSKNWLRAAAQSLKPLILKIPEVRKHSHFKVRLHLVEEISHLMENCIMNLKPCINVMIEVLISSSEDEEEEVRDAADFAITRFENRCRSKNGQIYLSLIEENLNSLINKMPNVIHLQDDKGILNVMKSLCGVLKILSNSHKLEQVINFSTNLNRLIRVLLLSLKFELYPEISTLDYSIWENETTNPPLWRKNWKRFRYFTDERIICKLIEISSLLGKNSEVETVLDHLFDRFKEEYSFRNEILMLINEIVAGSSDIKDNVIKQFLDLYLDRDNLYLVLEVDDDQCMNIHQSHANIIMVALLMEGLGKMASAVGKRFEDYLLRSLYFVIEKMGSRYSIIRSSALAAAVKIATAVGLEGNVGLLIKNNIDYLTYHITVKLKRNHSGVFDVVTVLMNNSPFEEMTNLEEIINNALKSSSEQFESSYTVSYLRLFQTFVLCVNKNLKQVLLGMTDEMHNPVEEKKDVDLFMEYIQEQEKLSEEREHEEMKGKELEEVEVGVKKEGKKREHEEAKGRERKEVEEKACEEVGEIEDEKMEVKEREDVEEDRQKENEGQDVSEDEAYDISEEDKCKMLPRHIRLTVAIAQNALNYLPSSDLEKKLIVLEILNESILILADWENELLPLVHKIWSPLVNRFGQIADPLIINRSFTLLYNLSRTSKDFIRRRTLKNVLPKLREFLLKSAEKSKLKDSGTGICFTQSFKLQRDLLDKLGLLSVDLGLTGKELDCIAECALPYLSALQPLPLQENCRKLFADLKDYDPYFVWYKLHKLGSKSDCSKNVEIILNCTLPYFRP